MSITQRSFSGSLPLLFSLALLGCIFCPRQATAQVKLAEPIAAGQRVYSAGHSFHVFMPGILADMAKKSEIKDHILVGLSAIGGSRVIQHWDVPDDKNTAKVALRTGKVDVLTLAPIQLPDNKALNTLLQGLAWESVSKHPLSGLQAEPPAVSQAPADSSFPAHRVVGNVYYVGSKALASYLILIGNLDYPDIAADFGQTFAVLKSLPCDIFLGAHGEYYGMLAKCEQHERDPPTNPFIDPDGYLAYVTQKEAVFREKLAGQRRGCFAD